MSSTPKITAFAFNAANVAPQRPLDPVPSEWYSTILTDAQLEPTANGAGIRLNAEFEIFEGQYKGRKMFDGFNVQHSTAQAQEIGQAQLSAVCHATGTIQISDLTQLLNKPFACKWGLEDKRTVTDPTTGQVKNYEPRNVFKGAKPLSEMVSKPAAPAGQPGVPSGVPAGMPAPGWAAGVKLPAAPAAAPSLPPVAPPTPPAERFFYLFYGDQNNIPKLSESQLAATLATIPAGAHVALPNPDGSNSGKWIPIAQAGIGQKPAAPAFTPPPPPPPVAAPPSFAPPVSPAAAFSPPFPAPAAAPSAGTPSFTPPWGKTG